ncbi:hypothetical protein G7046_g4135 [Stylonectria norvegica]|nr:hypothetical protein G7046_g4135 [Stylonectria norvegica]
MAASFLGFSPGCQTQDDQLRSVAVAHLPTAGRGAGVSLDLTRRIWEGLSLSAEARSRFCRERGRGSCWRRWWPRTGIWAGSKDAVVGSGSQKRDNYEDKRLRRADSENNRGSGTGRAARPSHHAALHANANVMEESRVLGAELARTGGGLTIGFSLGLSSLAAMSERLGLERLRRLTAITSNTVRTAIVLGTAAPLGIGDLIITRLGPGPWPSPSSVPSSRFTVLDSSPRRLDASTPRRLEAEPPNGPRTRCRVSTLRLF